MLTSYVTADKKATFVCPRCKKPRRADVSKLSGLNQAVRLRVRCPCGHVYTVALERRQRRRKQVSFPGIAYRLIEGAPSGRHLMTVMEISPGGMKLRFGSRGAFEPGDTLRVEFRLDDPRRSLIRKEVLVSTVHERKVGVELIDMNADDANDKALGFYFL